MEPASLEEFNKRMSDLTTGHIRQDAKGNYHLYVEIGNITQWSSRHKTLEAACAAAQDIGCGKAIYRVPNSEKAQRIHFPESVKCYR